MSDTKLIPCKRCKRMPVIKEINDLFYVQCPHAPYTDKKGNVVKCDKWGQYEFLGTSKVAATRNWYWANAPKKELLDLED